MTTLRTAAITAAMAVAAGGLGGCAQASKLLSFLHLKSSEPKLAIRPMETPVELETVIAPEDRMYARAKQAIEARDYATALDLLQMARQRSPNDGRVLNAMGVVYDKLGRFDLSRRYYEQALALQPNSPTVMANIEYSSKLQAYSTTLREEPGGLGLAASPTIQLAGATPARRSSQPLTLGSSIRIVDASGQAGLARGVQRRLVAKGWSVEADPQHGGARDMTVIVFKAEHRRVAQALAHTLPFRTTLQACTQDCAGIRLVVGANARLQGRG